MSNISFQSLFILLIFTLIGCQQSFSREYLLQNPDQLQKEFNRCRDNNENSVFCDKVIQTAEEFTKLLNQQHSNPEQFGKQILQMQQQLAKNQADLKKAQQDLALSPESKEAKEKLKLAEEAYKAQLDSVKIYLAVVSEATTPGF